MRRFFADALRLTISSACRTVRSSSATYRDRSTNGVRSICVHWKRFGRIWWEGGEVVSGWDSSFRSRRIRNDWRCAEVKISSTASEFSDNLGNNSLPLHLPLCRRAHN